jgi:hypothetical protein
MRRARRTLITGCRFRGRINVKIFRTTLLAASICLAGTAVSFAADSNMSFFVTSTGSGDGANLGGIVGADDHCTALATAAGAPARTWRAYLSTEEDGKRGVSARDRIGNGPWHNARGELIAVDLDQLHLNPNIVKRTAIDENGNPVKGRGDKPNEHDLLTGSMADGTAYWPDDKDHTCSSWTSNGDGSAQVGHHDRHGGGNTSWNSAHASRGCSQDNLRGTGGAGLFMCFAAD